MKKWILGIITLALVVNGAVFASGGSLDEMLKDALQDEVNAKATYEAIIEKFGETRPYTNIIKAEQTHMDIVEALYNRLDKDIPQLTADPAAIPDTFEEALALGAVAEVNNIEMYDTFLEADLPADVRTTFEYLKNASENHLRAFSRDRGTGNGIGNGQGNRQGNGRGNGQGNGQGNGTGNKNQSGQSNDLRQGPKNQTGPRYNDGTCVLID